MLWPPWHGEGKDSTKHGCIVSPVQRHLPQPQVYHIIVEGGCHSLPASMQGDFGVMKEGLDKPVLEGTLGPYSRLHTGLSGMVV